MRNRTNFLLLIHLWYLFYLILKLHTFSVLNLWFTYAWLSKIAPSQRKYLFLWISSSFSSISDWYHHEFDIGIVDHIQELIVIGILCYECIWDMKIAFIVNTYCICIVITHIVEWNVCKCLVRICKCSYVMSVNLLK